MSGAHDVQVRMCEIAVGSARDGALLHATLGSCVGIGLMWRERDLYGLAHCLLPGGAHSADHDALAARPARYVTEALPALLALMGATHAQEREIEAVLAGGANMMSQRVSTLASIGEQNIRVAQQLLAQTAVRMVHVDVGGDCGRQLSIDCSQHHYAIRKFSRSS